MVYLCGGEESEKIDWFRKINIAGLELTEQEMRNAIYPGPWVSDAKRYFSKPECVAYKLGGKYLKGEVDRQASPDDRCLIANVPSQNVTRYEN